MIGPVEADPEYQLIVDSNNMVVEIDNEISEYFKLTRVSRVCWMSLHNQGGTTSLLPVVYWIKLRVLSMVCC